MNPTADKSRAPSGSEPPAGKKARTSSKSSDADLELQAPEGDAAHLSRAPDAATGPMTESEEFQVGLSMSSLAPRSSAWAAPARRLTRWAA